MYLKGIEKELHEIHRSDHGRSSIRYVVCGALYFLWPQKSTPAVQMRLSWDRFLADTLTRMLGRYCEK